MKLVIRTNIDHGCLRYTCRHCGQEALSPFPRPRGERPDTCPACWRRLHPQVSKPSELDEDQRRELSCERVKRSQALARAAKRAARIAADMAAHPEALDACVEGVIGDIR